MAGRGIGRDEEYGCGHKHRPRNYQGDDDSERRNLKTGLTVAESCASLRRFHFAPGHRASLGMPEGWGGSPLGPSMMHQTTMESVVFNASNLQECSMHYFYIFHTETLTVLYLITKRTFNFITCRPGRARFAVWAGFCQIGHNPALFLFGRRGVAARPSHGRIYGKTARVHSHARRDVFKIYIKCPP